MLRNTPTRWTLGLALALSMSACGSLLPETKTHVPSAWKSYNEAHDAINKVVPFRTRRTDLGPLGFDPATNPNVIVLNYSDILRHFLPTPDTRLSIMDAGLKSCLSAASTCQGLSVDVSDETRERHGEFWQDFLNFRRDTHVTGWRFNAIILLKEDVVVYRTWGGAPLLERDEYTHNPLGPIQNIGERVPRPL
ncbi:MAG: hypothetical protein JO218_16005 [Burkholderiales bacterium]|nr:hypothetical protein [Burkholderiales bacterium]